jgi:hypothetical protein
MKYAFVFFLATALPAQISNLTTTANGSELQFISNCGTLSDPVQANRLYAYADGPPVALFRAESPSMPTPPGSLAPIRLTPSSCVAGQTPPVSDANIFIGPPI